MRLKKEYANTFQDGEVKSKGYFYEKVYGPNGKITKWYHLTHMQWLLFVLSIYEQRHRAIILGYQL